MSLFTYTPIASNNTDKVNILGTQVQEAFELVSQFIFNGSYINSKDNSIGNNLTEYLKPTGSSKIIGYTQPISFSNGVRELILDLVPSADILDLNSITINNLTTPSEIYTYKSSGILEDDNDFYILGRKLIFKTAPAGLLNITYNGYAVGTSDQLYQNIISFNGVDSFSPVYNSGTDTYTITGHNFLSKLSPDLQLKISSNVPLIGDICIYNADTSESIPLTEVSISSSDIEFKVFSQYTSPINSVKIAANNTTVADLLKAIYTMFYEHNHNYTEGAAITHSSLVGLVDNSSDIKYESTVKPNYDHPQYFNREGFINDTTVFNNSILGDVLLGSTTDSSYYNNLDSNSNKIVFGSYTNGHKVYFDKNLNSLVLDASEDKNGLSIKSDFNRTILKLNNNYITNKKLLDDSVYLEVMLEESTNDLGVIKFTKRVVNNITNEVTSEDSAKIFVKYAEIGKLRVNEDLNINTDGQLSIGDPSLYTLKLNNLSELELNTTETEDTSGYNFNIKINVKAKDILADVIRSPNITVSDTSKITFSSSTSTNNISYANNQLTFTSDTSFNYKLNGYRKGITFDNKYWMYVSSPTGESLPSNNYNGQDLYVETTGTGNVYFIKSTDNSFTVGTDSLISAERADVYAGKFTASSFNIPYEIGEINAVCLDTLDNNKIFAGKDANSNLATILKTNNKVLVVNAYNPSVVGSPAISYGEIVSGYIRSAGDKTTDYGFYGNVVVPLNNKLLVQGEATFSNEIKFTNKVTADKIVVDNLTATVSSLSSCDVVGTLTAKNIEASDNGYTRLGLTEVKKALQVSEGITQNNSNSTSVFNGSLKVVGEVTFNSSLDMTSSTIKGLINSTSPDPDEAVAYSLLQTSLETQTTSLSALIDTKVNAIIGTVIDKAYPLGTVYMNESDSRSPAVILGVGVWARSYEGRVPVGLVENTYILSTITNADIKAALQQGIGGEFGEWEHTMTEDELAPHRHLFGGSTGPGNDGGARDGTLTMDISLNAGYDEAYDTVGTAASPDKYITSNSGGNQPFNIFQPSKITSIWTRVG